MKKNLLEKEMLEEQDLITKEEMNLTEYPLMLVSERIPKGVKTIKYEDWVTVAGEKVQLKWIVTGSDLHGLPTGGDQDIYLALMEIGRENGFKDKKIAFQSIYSMLKKMNIPDTKGEYVRFMRALDRFVGMTIYTENAIWDREKKSYVKKVAFNLLDHYQLVERYRRNEPNVPLPFGYIQLTDYFFNLIKKGNLKDLNLTFYLKLPNPLTRRLYRYLDKKRYYGRSFTMNVRRFTKKLGFVSETVDRYYPADIRRILKPALDVLIRENYLERYSFEPGKEGEKLVVFFALAGERRLDTPLNPEAAMALDDFLSYIGDDGRSRPYWTSFINTKGLHLLRVVQSEVRQAELESRIDKTKAKMATDLGERHLGKKPFGSS